MYKCTISHIFWLEAFILTLQYHCLHSHTHKVNSLLVIVITNLTRRRYDTFFSKLGRYNVLQCLFAFKSLLERLYNTCFALYNAYWEDVLMPFFCRKILNVGVKKISNNNMVCFQLGRHPLQIRRKLRTVQMLKLIIIVF